MANHREFQVFCLHLDLELQAKIIRIINTYFIKFWKEQLLTKTTIYWANERCDGNVPLSTHQMLNEY